MKKYIFMAFAVVGLASCSDFLDREPLDFGNEDSYYNTANDLMIAANDFYEILPLNNALWGGLYTSDTESDNQVSTSYVQAFYEGEKKTPKVESSEWNFKNLRGINFFIQKIYSRNGQISGNPDLVDHYLGEGYFFRAYEYFRLLRNYGDVPIITSMQSDNREELARNTVRRPRNEVARYILSQLDTAAFLMQEKAPEAGRVTKDAAYALKSRVALYEGTWEKYHAGTCFVPGNSKWPGKNTWSDFSFPAGSAEAEYNWFFEQAYKAAELVIGNHPLDADYQGMFTATTEFADNDEVILARYYLNGVITHSCSAYIKNGGGCGVTRAAVNTFLMENGLPHYANGSGYKGDKTSYLEFQGRDSRLTGSVRAAGSDIKISTVDGKTVRDTVFYYRPYIYNSGRERATTGYELQKWCSDDETQRQQYSCTTAVPLLRSAECYLNYIEAYYERHGNLGGNCDQYWRELRRRSGVDEDYTKTINATVLSEENDLAVWSKGVEVDKTLYNIRRERRCELLAEGLRLDDLKRWRSLDKMVNYQPEGFNLWAEIYTMYSSEQVSSSIVSQKEVSTYMRPLQISATSVVYNGYTFPKPHYLEPIPISEFLMAGNSLYQNPGWPSAMDGTADYGYDCD